MRSIKPNATHLKFSGPLFDQILVGFLKSYKIRLSDMGFTSTEGPSWPRLLAPPTPQFPSKHYLLRE